MKKLAIFTTVLAVIAVLTTHPIQATEPVIQSSIQEDLVDEQVPLALPNLPDLPENSITGIPWDMTALDDWCGQPEGVIRVIGAFKVDANTLETEDGHQWGFEGVTFEDGLYIMWIDNNNTPDDVTDDLPIHIWKEVMF